MPRVRNKKIVVSCTEKEYEEIKKRSLEECASTITDYVRRAALGKLSTSK